MNIRLPGISINSTPLNKPYSSTPISTLISTPLNRTYSGTPVLRYSYIIYINIYRGATLALNPSNASNSTSGAVKFPQIRQMRQMRQMVI